MPAWVLKMGTVVATLASTAGFWGYVTTHVKPVRAPLHPKTVAGTASTTVTEAGSGTTGETVVYLNDDEAPSSQPSASGPASAGPAPSAAPRRVVVRVVPGAPQAVPGQVNVGAAWLGNNTGVKPVTNTYVS